ncbi:MAG: hypothetical protein CMK71_02715 [Pseudomonadaceae bacterium]|jgi:hypothetical protein|nr:hypothetical protein [Pseudomonadaceae bacterium]
MTGHTKEPWKFIHVIGQCTIWAGERQLLKYTSPDSENLANARLMSAAPKLLAALERLKAEIILSDIDPAYIESHFSEHIKNATAAISDAIGELS